MTVCWIAQANILIDVCRGFKDIEVTFTIYIYRHNSDISRTLVGNIIVDHSDIIAAAPVQLDLHSRPNT